MYAWYSTRGGQGTGSKLIGGVFGLEDGCANTSSCVPCWRRFSPVTVSEGTFWMFSHCTLTLLLLRPPSAVIPENGLRSRQVVRWCHRGATILPYFTVTARKTGRLTCVVPNSTFVSWVLGMGFGSGRASWVHCSSIPAGSLSTHQSPRPVVSLLTIILQLITTQLLRCYCVKTLAHRSRRHPISMLLETRLLVGPFLDTSKAR